MTIGTKNGAIILKSGSVAQGCSCCGYSCSCVAPQQMNIEFIAVSNTSQFSETVVLTQSAYTAIYGAQITDVQMGTFDSNSPYPGQPYYGVAGYYYEFVFTDPVLGSAPTAAGMQGNCQWADVGGLRLRVYARLEVMRRESATTIQGFDCYYLNWSYLQQGVDLNCNLAQWEARSGWSVLPNDGGNNPYIAANFAHKSASGCCIPTISQFSGRYINVSGEAGFQGSGSMTVLDCA